MAQGDTEVIKSFLVGLGFDVDEGSLAVFNKSIKEAALRVTALYGSISAFASSMIYAFSKISEGFEEMGYQYHIIAPAINKAIVLRNELMKAYGAAGINIRKVIIDSVRLNMSLTKTKYAMEAIYKSVGSKFFGLLEKQSDTFRKKLYGNMPAIIHALEKFVKVVFTAFDIVIQLGQRIWQILTRVYDFFVMLDDKTDGWSTIILGVIAAWKLLNLEFLATPLGMLIAGIVTLIALWDDFQVWKEGGKSLFDWSSFVPVINAVGVAIGHVKEYLDGAFTVIIAVGTAIWDLLHGNFSKAFTDIALGFEGFKDEVMGLVHALGSLLGVGNAVVDWASSFGSWDIGKKLGGMFNGGQATQPLGSTTNNSSNRVVANQQTSITVQGSPNAQATGMAVAGAQGGVNRDMVRNLKGATR